MGLHGSKEERECKKQRKQCEKQRRRIEKERRRIEKERCRPPKRCRRTPYVYVEDDCCEECCCDNYVELDCFTPTSKYRVLKPARHHLGHPQCSCNVCQCCPCTCNPYAAASACLPMCCANGAMPINPCLSINSSADLNRIMASFPPGTDFSGFLESVRNIVSTHGSSLPCTDVSSIGSGLSTQSPSLFNANPCGQQVLLPTPRTTNEQTHPQVASAAVVTTTTTPVPSSPPVLAAPAVNRSCAPEIPALPPLPRELLYPRRDRLNSYGRPYAYDDFDSDLYARRRSKPKCVEFYDDYGLDNYLSRRRQHLDYDDDLDEDCYFD